MSVEGADGGPRTPEAILTKILGTTTTWKFATDVLVSYFQQNVTSFLKTNWENEDVMLIIEELRVESEKLRRHSVKCPTIADNADGKTKVLSTAIDFIKWHFKNIPLAADSTINVLQGLMWGIGFKSGALKAPFYEDVLPAMEQWKSKGIKLFTMSAGSVSGQEAYFTYANHGNFSNLINGYIGIRHCGLNKYESSAYGKLASIINTRRNKIAFITSNVREARAAAVGGLMVYFVLRPDNKKVNPKDIQPFYVIQSFSDLVF